LDWLKPTSEQAVRVAFAKWSKSEVRYIKHNQTKTEKGEKATKA